MSRDPERILDEYLVCLSQGGSRTAFDHLVRRWTPRLLRYSGRQLGSQEAAKDIVHEVWGAVIGGLRRLQDPALFASWIYRIATHKCADAVRANERQRRQCSRAEAEFGRERSLADPGAPSEAGLDLAKFVRCLPEEQRVVIHLFYGEDLGIEEIAEVIGIPAGTVKSRLHHARQALKTRMGAEYERAWSCIREALKAGQVDVPEELGVDQPLHRQIVETFRGRFRWLNVAGAVVAFVLFVIACGCAWRFVRAPELRAMLLWGAGAFLALWGLALIKTWFWMELQKLAILREVKRLELQAARVAARWPDKH
jgi:RNA polymerase sigma-70 factor (ECF subfamily)